MARATQNPKLPPKLPTVQTPTHRPTNKRYEQISELSESSASDSAIPKMTRRRTSDLVNSRQNSVPSSTVEKSSEIHLKILRGWSKDQRQKIEFKPFSTQGTSSSSAATVSPLSENEAQSIKSFVLAKLQQAESSQNTNSRVESLKVYDSLLDQCLGLSPLTMRASDWETLVVTHIILSDIDLIEQNPAFQKFSQAVEACPQRIMKANDDMFKTITIALDECLHKDKYPLQLSVDPASEDTAKISHEKLEIFMKSVKTLLDQQSADLTASDLQITTKFLKKLFAHVPPPRLGNFESFVHIANRYIKAKLREV
jgi:hypothetical protein